MFTDRVSGELSVSRETFQRHVTTFIGVFPVSSSPEFALYPVDANVSYHFASSNRWKPYAGVGARYEQVSQDLGGPGPSVFTARAVAPVVSGGLTFQFRPDLGIRLDGREVFRSAKTYITKPVFKNFDAGIFAPSFEASLGLSVRF